MRGLRHHHAPAPPTTRRHPAQNHPRGTHHHPAKHCAERTPFLKGGATVALPLHQRHLASRDDVKSRKPGTPVLSPCCPPRPSPKFQCNQAGTDILHAHREQPLQTLRLQQFNPPIRFTGDIRPHRCWQGGGPRQAGHSRPIRFILTRCGESLTAGESLLCVNRNKKKRK